MKKVDILKIQKLIIFGCGSIGKCIIHYLENFFNFDYNSSLIMVEKYKNEKHFPSIDNAIKKGGKFIKYEITDDNIDDLLQNIIKVNKYDIIIDLTTRTNTFNIFKKVRQYSLLYINTSIEDYRDKNLYIEKSIYIQHMNLYNINLKLKNYSNTSTLIEYGMNPGLISCFVKYGIRNLTKEVLEYQIENNNINNELYEAYQLKRYNKMAKILGIRVIHCSEIDTQVPKNQSKYKNTLLNTWSCLGLIDEGTDPLEISLGTHENIDNILIKYPKSNFFEQHLLINKLGYQTKFKSVVPIKINKDLSILFEEFVGRSVHHGESISLNRFLSDETYSPTINYVYKVSPLTDKFLEDYSSEELMDLTTRTPHIDWHVMNVYDNKLTGNDNVGALFILEKNPMTLIKEPFMFWTGSILDTKYTKKVLEDEYFGPTSIQVMAGVLSGLSYIIENKELGLIYGEDVPEDYVIDKCKKFLGHFYCGIINEKINLDYHVENLLVD